MIRKMMVALMAWVTLSLQAGAQTEEFALPLARSTGVIEALSFGEATMVVGGERYEVAIDVEVEIGGTYGAFTMLEVGMPIHYEYLVISPTQRRVVLIEELPSGVDAEET